MNTSTALGASISTKEKIDVFSRLKYCHHTPTRGDCSVMSIKRSVSISFFFSTLQIVIVFHEYDCNTGTITLQPL